MTQAQQTMPLFPLSGHVLPGGTMRLRIFEPRYIRMVKEACNGTSCRPIGMCMLNENGDRDLNTHIHPIGTAATIIDFEQLPDGLLGITVAGQYLFRIADIQVQDDGLRVGHTDDVSAWPSQALSAADKFLAEQLVEIYNTYPELAVAYNNEQLQRADWVCLRWLELVPVSAQTKQELLQAPTADAALTFLRDLVIESKQDNEQQAAG
ncbi:LON peptidase substrate-binding domain-containing protein [Pseudidiomarina marina]|uniref:Peptidase S16 n=1 Tax=Pseudidiomarina marina TaxID=502366 RepID=A0A432YJQ4_9GAMM|nr:LON peptidase substrate-binding domain-containing protein [Pseudidiomarina marina]RUO61075.1 peptidase S16 [Pseudidiomarina marina]